MERYVCVHGHFYQPPRENPWLETVELQEGAYPYHDWNERITAECYAQNAASRILDADGRIVAIVNNYAGMSFDVGPTLLGWMETAAPAVHEAIVDADRRSRERFSGHGSAMAQAYNHVIMPLADERDRRTQIAWGMADFVARFGRRPEGMWLPEAAVDTPTLEALAASGIRFTVLEPHQAARVRDIGATAWEDVSDGSIDTGVAYRAVLPSGRDLAVFFYDGAISRAVAFEGLLADGGSFAARLTGAVDPDRDGPQLVNFATDGESYGHHHRHGDMALAVALATLEDHPDVALTNYGEFLERFPPTREVEVADATSWSCAHGVERWRADCGCADGGRADGDQSWRAPLRDALDWLRDELAPRFEDRAGRFLTDPWAARDDHIDVILDRSPATGDAFLAKHARRPLEDGERVAVWKLLEMQRFAQLMYTSCGWFFDDLARIETVQILRYAGRAIQLWREVGGADLEPRFVDLLAGARSNDPAVGDGRRLWEQQVRPAVVELRQVAAHHAVASLFDRPDPLTRHHAYEVEREAEHTAEAGAARLALGRVRVVSTVTEESARFEYGVLHLGDHNIDGAVRARSDDRRWDSTVAAIGDAFAVADFPEVIRRLDREFGGERFSLRSLFRDEQRRILRTILDSSIDDARSAYRRIYRERAPLMRYLTELGARLPRTFHRAAEVVVIDDLRREFSDPDLDPRRVDALLADARAWDLELDEAGLAHALHATIEVVTERVAAELPQPSLFQRFGEPERVFFRRALTLIEVARSLPFEVDLWRAQNLMRAAVDRTLDELTARADAGDEAAATWIAEMRRLGEALAVAVP